MGDLRPYTIGGMYLAACERFANRPALRYLPGHCFAALTYADLHAAAAALASDLASLGVSRGDRVLLFSENRPEWVITDFALNCIGAVPVPVHSVLSAVQVREIVEESRPRFAVVSGVGTYARLESAREELLSGAPLIVFDEDAALKVPGALAFSGLLGGAGAPADLHALSSAASPDDLASITFTSGTTGSQKGVMLSHRNIVSDTYAAMKAQPYTQDDRFISILPLSHVFERVAGLYSVLGSGASIRQIASADEFQKAAQEVRPTVIVAVPRLFEKIQETAAEMASASKLQSRVFGLAFDDRVSRLPVLRTAFDRLVYARVRHVFGGDLRYSIIGGAKLPLSVSAFFDKTGIRLYEGYGLTETSPIIGGNTSRRNHYGTVGLPFEEVHVRIAEDGEVQVSGDTVMMGYLRTEETAEVMTADGWLKTGDLGSFNAEGDLVLTGRKKDLLVLTTGKKVAPSAIEAALLASPHIAQACVLGDGRKHVCAVLVPNDEAIRRTLAEAGGGAGKGADGRGDRALSGTDTAAVRDLLAREASRTTAALSSIEQVRAFVIADEPFSEDNGLLTPTFKMKRTEIAKRYEAEVARLYA